jgi:UDP-glucose 4-epimerase
LPHSIDAVLHVAGISQTNGTADDILACNVAGARNLQRYALEAGAAKAIYTSTLSIHGRIVEPVVTENTVSVEPDLYGASKLLGERLFAATADRLPAVAIRLPGVLGPGAHRAWIPTTLEKIRQGREIAIYNPEGQFNNAAHVDDLGAFVAGLLRDDWSGFHAFPVGAKGAITIAGVIERLSAGMPQPAMRIMQEARNSFLISSEYATGMFGYRPMEIGAMLDKYVSESLAEPISTRKTQTGLRRQG